MCTFVANITRKNIPFKLNIPSPLEKLSLPILEVKGLEVWVKRDDLIHETISGNKWRKLKYNIQYFQSEMYAGIVTFGGAHSNHILASAFICNELKIPIVGLIRGDADVPLSDTLLHCTRLGMQLDFVDRTTYRNKTNPDYLNKIKNKYPYYYIIPEGGANKLGIKGCEDIVAEIDIDFDYITVDCGTGATLSGMVSMLKHSQQAIGVQVLKGRDFISDEVWRTNPKSAAFEVWTDYHFGGYAKYKPVLIDFMRRFYSQTGIRLDPVYTGKQFFAVFDMIEKDYFPKGSKIILMHTGGLQGISGFEKRYKIKIY